MTEEKALSEIYLNGLMPSIKPISTSAVSFEIDLQSVYKEVGKIAKREMARIETILRFRTKKGRKRKKSIKIIAYNIQALKS